MVVFCLVQVLINTWMSLFLWIQKERERGGGDGNVKEKWCLVKEKKVGKIYQRTSYILSLGWSIRG